MPFSIIIGIIHPITFAMAKCQSLQGIRNQDSRRFPFAFRPFVQRSFFNCIIISFLWHNIYCSWLMSALCHQHKSDTFTNSAKCNKILSLMDVEKSHRNKHNMFLVLSLSFVMQCSLKCNLTEFLSNSYQPTPFFFFFLPRRLTMWSQMPSDA